MQIKRITKQDDLKTMCSQLCSSDWGSDNEMAAFKPSELGEFLEQATNMLVVGYKGDVIVCSALCYQLRHPDNSRRSLYIDELDTKPAHRRKGYASMMIDWLLGFAADHNLREVWLTTEIDDNNEANAFYKSLQPSEDLRCKLYSYKSRKKRS